jgi:hypothetical protein
MQKLEILTQFKKKYGNQINPHLIEMKYCQSINNAQVEMHFRDDTTPFIIDLAFIGGEIVKDEEGNDADILSMFNPDVDIIDNAKTLIELDSHTLINCIDKLFTEEAANAISELYFLSIKNK